MLKDPRRFSEESLLVPVSLGPYLQNIDGTNTVQEIIEAGSSTGEQPIPVAILGDLLGRLDQMFLLENGAYTDEMQKRLKVCGLAPIYMTLWAAGAKTGTWNGYLQCQADEADTSFVSIAGAALYG